MLRFASKWLLTSDFEVLEASGVPKGDQESPESSQEAPKKLPRSPQEAPKRLLGGALGALGGPKSSPSHDPRYIHRFPSLQEPSRRSPGHDLSALSSDYERREALDGAARARSIGPVDVSEPPGAQNSNSGGVEAAILDTFIVFEPPEGPLGPLHFDPPGIPSKRPGRGIRRFSSKTSILRRRELDFRFP